MKRKNEIRSCPLVSGTIPLFFFHTFFDYRYTNLYTFCKPPHKMIGARNSEVNLYPLPVNLLSGHLCGSQHITASLWLPSPILHIKTMGFASFLASTRERYASKTTWPVCKCAVEGQEHHPLYHIKRTYTSLCVLAPPLYPPLRPKMCTRVYTFSSVDVCGNSLSMGNAQVGNGTIRR